jgi:plasmid stabilization system protein ParE
MAGERLEIHPEALEEIKSAVRWYLGRSESAAIRFVEAVDEAVALIAESPNR